MPFRFRQSTCLSIALWLFVSIQSALGDQSQVALEIVDTTPPGITDRCDVTLAARVLEGGVIPLRQVNLRLAYNTSRLTLTTVEQCESVIDSCFLRFLLSDISSIWPERGTIILVLHANSESDVPHLSDSTPRDLIRLSFEWHDPGNAAREETELAFCWLEPADNLIRRQDLTVLLASNHVYDPDTVDIACPDCPLPSFRGLPDSVLSTLFNGDTTAVRAVDFQSLRLSTDQPTGVADPDGATHTKLPQAVLHQNYPNPFNSSTRISFELRRSGPWRLSILNLLGETVWSNSGAAAAAGRHDLIWSGCDRHGRPVAAGVYLYRIESGGEVQSRKLLLLK